MKNLNNYKIENKKILFRADLNVPVVDRVITDISRIEAIKSSIDKLTSNKNKIFIMAHFGRPKGEIVDKYSLKFEASKDEPKEINKQSFQPAVKNLFTNQTKRGCEWPEGHPDESDFKFCSKDRFEDKPYCIDHCAVAYVIPEKEEEKQHVTQRV